MFRFLFLFLFPLPLMAQVDQRKLDSLSRHIDSSQKALRHWQDSFTKRQDSVYNTQLKKEDRPGIQALPEEKEKKIKGSRTCYPDPYRICVNPAGDHLVEPQAQIAANSQSYWRSCCWQTLPALL
jgi:hypothetical protein